MTSNTAQANKASHNLYASFDRFPSTKGAATHIRYMTETLFNQSHQGTLCVLGDEQMPAYQKESHIEIFRFKQSIPNFLQRTIAFGRWLSDILQTQELINIAHYRDPWSAFPILSSAKAKHTVYEVNGLPSIELAYSYPHISPDTLNKIYQLEQLCLEQSDQIIVPAQTTKQHLQQRGIAEHKISVIANGAHLIKNALKPISAPENYFIYFGAAQRWQGLDILLKAFAQIVNNSFNHSEINSAIKLVLCIGKHQRSIKHYRKLAKKLGIEDKIDWHFSIQTDELQAWIHHALASIAPLTACQRNVDQGCCPLKILESMACGTAVIASDLAVVRELMSDNKQGLLVQPGRVEALAFAMNQLLQYEHLPKANETKANSLNQTIAQAMGKQGQQTISEQFTWDATQEKLHYFYQNILR